MLAFALMNPLGAQQAPTGVCRVTGKVTSGTMALPGVAIAIKAGDTVKGMTSTETDGGFGLTLTPGTYSLTAELTGFSHAQQTVTIPAEGNCSQAVNFALTLAPRNALTATQRAPQQSAAPGAAAPTGMRGAAPAGAGGTPAQSAAGGRGRGQTGFQTLGVEQQADSATAAAQASTPENEAAAVQALLPPGFSPDTSGGDAIAITGNNASLDRGMMQDRFDAIGRGEFDPASRRFRPGLRTAGRRRPGTRRCRRLRTRRPRRPGRSGRTRRSGRAGRTRRSGRWRAGRARRRRRRVLPRRTRRAAESLQRHGQLHLRRLGARQRALPAAS